jgi:hypothetical protein
VEDYLANLFITERQLALRSQIIRVFKGAGNTGMMVRSAVLTPEQATDGVPDALRAHSMNEFFAMVEEHIIWAAPAYPAGYYILNPNRKEIIDMYLSGRIIPKAPLEDYIPEGFEKEYAFKTNSGKDAKGESGTYYYYRNCNDRFDYTVLIENSRKSQPDRKNLGSLRDTKSVLSEVLAAINKVTDDRFIKARLEPLIGNKQIVENRQPVRAAIDVLEHLGYVKKTGRRWGRSEEYERTDKQAEDYSLEKFGFNAPENKRSDLGEKP